MQPFHVSIVTRSILLKGRLFGEVSYVGKLKVYAATCGAYPGSPEHLRHNAVRLKARILRPDPLLVQAFLNIPSPRTHTGFIGNVRLLSNEHVLSEMSKPTAARQLFRGP